MPPAEIADPAPGADSDAGYWDGIVGTLGTNGASLWRDHSDMVNSALLERWLPAQPRRVLKTDLFDEVAGEGLYPLLGARADEVVGIDVSPRVVKTAQDRRPGMTALAADVRRLPLSDASFDLVVSNSTLDHFASLDALGEALRELHRVLRPGGQLILTLDNPVNPVVRLRNALAARAGGRRRLAPYRVGATCGPRRAPALVREAGFDVLEVGGVMHFPRIVGVLAEPIARRHPVARGRLLALALACERLRHLPSRYLTAYFIAVRAVKPQLPPQPGCLTREPAGGYNRRR